MAYFMCLEIGFETKKEWIDFGNNLLRDDVIKDHINISYLNSLINNYGTMDNLANVCFDSVVRNPFDISNINSTVPDNLETVFSNVFTFSPSKKTVNIINDWMKNNHYESNYFALEIWDGKRGKDWLNLDEFLLKSDSLGK